MPNVHMQEAARNIRSAISDINLKIQQSEAESHNRTREIDQRINEIRTEQTRVGAFMTQETSDVDRSRQTNHLRELEQEISNLNQEKFNVNDNLRKIQSELNNQINEVDGLARRLEAIA